MLDRVGEGTLGAGAVGVRGWVVVYASPSSPLSREAHLASAIFPRTYLPLVSK